MFCWIIIAIKILRKYIMAKIYLFRLGKSRLGDVWISQIKMITQIWSVEV